MKPPVPPRRPAAIDRTQIDAPRPAVAVDEPSTVADPIKLGPGLRIEHYELIRELGRGGMGQVFLARDTRLGRRVAMKFLVASSPKFTHRLLVEARATAQCSHENIVVIHAVDEYLGLPYLVLEYVEGATLGALLAEKRLPVGRALEIILPVVRALECAHAQAIIHRDLKPDNIVVTATGTIKVLDFGIAKLVSAPDDGRPGAIIGTLPYMSPEQLGTDDVDHRSDLWAIGILLYEMLAGKHPLEPVTQGRLFGAAAETDEPMPSLAEDAPGLPDRLVAIVARCLAKRKADRYATAAELAADLEPLLPGRTGKSLGAEDSPYPGLTAFQEADANRFFGRTQDVGETLVRLRDQPLIGVVGPSGVGKSSFVRAGVVPALKSSGDPWEVMIVRPGRHPLAALAGMLESLRDSRDSDPVLGEDPARRLAAEPGTFGARLRARARRKRTQILLFVDQHEELYTLVGDPEQRRAFTACLAGAADDPSGPLRVIVAMRSDFLDRAAEDRRFVDELTRGLVFLQPPGRGALEAALTQPLRMLGYDFEPGIVDAMLAALETTPGALPLLQFTAAKLWEHRDRGRRALTRASYDAMGGVGGALATHADEVIAGMPAPDQRLARAVFQRLVTPERTRAIVDVAELREISLDVDRVLQLLVAARLLVVQNRGEGEGTAVELVHESLITRWPKLQRWLEEDHEDSAYLALVRAAAKQWDVKGRPQGLLWSGDAMEEARLWRARYHGELPARDQAFVDAVIALGTRAARIKRRAIVAAFVVLIGLVGAAGAALVQIRDAERTARHKATEARREADNAVAAKHAADASARQASAADKAKLEALEAAVAANQTIAKQQVELKTTKRAVDTAETRASSEAAKAAQARLAAADAQRKAAAEAAARKKLLSDQERLKAERRGKISNDLGVPEPAPKKR